MGEVFITEHLWQTISKSQRMWSRDCVVFIGYHYWARVPWPDPVPSVFKAEFLLIFKTLSEVHPIKQLIHLLRGYFDLQFVKKENRALKLKYFPKMTHQVSRKDDIQIQVYLNDVRCKKMWNCFCKRVLWKRRILLIPFCWFSGMLEFIWPLKVN